MYDELIKRLRTCAELHGECAFRQIQPEQETGRWELAIGYDPKRRFMCDQCAKMAYEPSKYCPNCGAKMEV